MLNLEGLFSRELLGWQGRGRRRERGTQKNPSCKDSNLVL
jgi:hypothetical protein